MNRSTYRVFRNSVPPLVFIYIYHTRRIYNIKKKKMFTCKIWFFPRLPRNLFFFSIGVSLATVLLVGENLSCALTAEFSGEIKKKRIVIEKYCI